MRLVYNIKHTFRYRAFNRVYMYINFKIRPYKCVYERYVRRRFVGLSQSRSVYIKFVSSTRG